MKQPPGHHLAELNWGRLRYEWDDPRVAPFVEALDLVNSAAARSPGFVWRMPDDQMEAEQLATEGAFGADPYVASTLSVWESPEQFSDFVFKTIHLRFMDRAENWFREGESGLVFWWIPEGTMPSVADGLARYRRMVAQGESAEGFAWRSLGHDLRENPRHQKI